MRSPQRMLVDGAFGMFALVTVVFCSVAWFALMQPSMRQVASLSWPRIPATLDRVDGRHHGSSSGGQYLAGSFSYVIDGHAHRSDRITWFDGDRLPADLRHGSTLLAAVDPADPDRAVLLPDRGPGMARTCTVLTACILSLGGTVLWLLVRCDRLAIRTSYGPGPRLRYSQM